MNLVERLNQAGSPGFDRSPGDPLCKEAADAIVRLEQERDAGKLILKEALDKMDRYVRRQGATRMAGRSIGDGSETNPNKGEHYPAVQSIMDKIRHHISK